MQGQVATESFYENIAHIWRNIESSWLEVHQQTHCQKLGLKKTELTRCGEKILYTLLMLNVDTLLMRNGRNLTLFATGTHKE